MTDAVTVGLFVLLASILGKAVDYVLSRRTAKAAETAALAVTAAANKIQPAQVANLEAETAKTYAETTAAQNATIGNQNATIAELLKTQSGMVSEISTVNSKLSEAQGQIVNLTSDLRGTTERAVGAEARAIGCEREVLDYKARYDALETRTKDYPHRLELAEAEIASLKAAAVLVADTNAANAQARLLTANTAAIAAGGTPATPTVSHDAESEAAADPPTLPPTS